MISRLQPRVYHTPSLITNISFVVTLLVGVVAWMNWRHSDKHWVSVSLTAFFLFALIATISAIRTRLTISDAAIEVTKGLGARRYDRGEIEDIAIAKGCPVILLLKDGKQVELPDLNISPLGLKNVVKAWLKSQSEETGSGPRW